MLSAEGAKPESEEMCVCVCVCMLQCVTVIATSHDEEMYVCVCSNVSVNGIVSFVSE